MGKVCLPRQGWDGIILKFFPNPNHSMMSPMDPVRCLRSRTSPASVSLEGKPGSVFGASAGGGTGGDREGNVGVPPALGVALEVTGREVSGCHQP